MRKRRLFVVALIVGAVSLGIPSQVSAAPSIPRSLTTYRTVVSQVEPGRSETLSVRMPWRANSSYLNLPCPGIAPELKMAFVHHTDTTNSYTRSQSAGIVRGIYAYHTNTRGYCDIAYNFLVDKYGQIFEGRNGGITKNVIGAHTGGYNYESVGVALLGNYATARPSSAMLTALTQLLVWRLDIAHIPPTGIVTMETGPG